MTATADGRMGPLSSGESNEQRSRARKPFASEDRAKAAFDTRRIPIVLAEQLMDVIDRSGATHTEIVAALEIAGSLLPVCTKESVAYEALKARIAEESAA